MRQQRRRDTGPAKQVRSELFRRGLRYRLEYQCIPESRIRVDIAFVADRVAVQVNGCFWHHCPFHGTLPKRHAEWWSDKLDRNVRRDALTQSRLVDAGWTTVVVWEHESPIEAADRIEAAIMRVRRLETNGGLGDTMPAYTRGSSSYVKPGTADEAVS
jgi:DNA mismatch endonuclease (patch repair protein)